jgi:hypothetical protein
MPVIGEPTREDRTADLIEALIEKLDQQINPPVVNVAPAPVNVSPPEVHVAAPEVHIAPKPAGWTFEVHRDAAGRIETITVSPKKSLL